jgi:Na+-transporting NADH:ubiquinone oxidoreductase subunit C
VRSDSTPAGAPGGLKAVFALPNDDTRKILAVALALCLVCSVVVSTAAVMLKPLQLRNAALAEKRDILAAAGLYEPGSDIEETFKASIDARVVELDSGLYAEGVKADSFSYRIAAADPATSRTLGDEDVARIRRRADQMPVYLVRGDGDKIETLILPVYGYGLWSTMHAFLALEGDGKTVRAVSFYDQRETAGLGGEIANPTWQASWQGKEATDERGNPVLQVVKGSVDAANPSARHQIDGLAGATLTSNGVTNLLTFWLGANGYGPYLARVRNGEG